MIVLLILSVQKREREREDTHKQQHTKYFPGNTFRYFIYGTLVLKGYSCMKVEHKKNNRESLLRLTELLKAFCEKSK